MWLLTEEGRREGAYAVKDIDGDTYPDYYDLYPNDPNKHDNKDWVLEIKEELKDNKIDIIFEHIGANTWNDSLRLLAKGGRIVTCGATTGASVQINLAHLFMKQQSILGATMSTIESFNEVMKLIENKIFFPFVDKVYNFSNIKDAHKRIEQRNQFGKVVLIP